MGEQYRMMGTEERLYKFKTVVGEFAVPDSLVKSQYINQLAGLVEECVDAKYSVEDFRKRLLHTFPLVEGKDDLDIRVLEQLYAKIKELDEKAINGIWVRIIKNAFAPLFCEKFDYIAGNPPWINWESLPDEYRQSTAPLWAKHDLFPHKGYETILGKSKVDVSILTTYEMMDNYLQKEGRLGFVITQSVFKTAGAGQGFRRFMLGDSTPIQVVTVDDMVELQPFEGASNRTSIVILDKGRPTEHPIPYNFWRKKAKGTSIGTDFPLYRVNEMASYRQFYAEPVDESDPTSPWLTAKPKAIKAAKKILGRSDYTAHAGLYNGGANGVYLVNIIDQRPDGLVLVSNITEGAKRKVENVQAALEPDLLYPLLRGRDIRRWQAVPSGYTIVTHLQGMRLNAITEEEMKDDCPKPYQYLKRFENNLRQRKDRGTKGIIEKGSPFYSMFAIGDYTFAPYKVVWTRVDYDIKGAVVSYSDVVGTDKVVVPIETAVLVAFDDLNEAHYFCAVLNSSPWRFVITSTAVHGTGGFGSPNVLLKARTPKFDRLNSAHQELAGLSKEAHTATALGEEDTVTFVEESIDELAAGIWGLTKEELKEIQESLAELK